MAHGHPIGPPLDKIAPDLDWLSFDVCKATTAFHCPSDSALHYFCYVSS